MTKAQLSMTFHWIYVFLAGGVILFFFIMIASRQKVSSEEQLSVVLAQKLDAIFTGAAQTKQTFEVIELPTLDIYFYCEDDAASYSIGESGSPRSVPVQPIFAPYKVLAEPRMHVWSLPFRMPFQVINLLMVDAPTITTFLVYDISDLASERMLDIIQEELPAQFNFVPITKDELLAVPSLSTPQVRLIFLTDVVLPSFVLGKDPRNVQIIHIESERAVTYYTMDGNKAVPVGTASIIQSFDDLNPALYAALFSDSVESYNCNMRKVFERLIILAEMYDSRAQTLKQRYHAAGNQLLCELQINPAFAQLKEQAVTCRDELSSCLAEVYSTAESIQRNNAFVQQQCAVLY